MGLVSLDNLEEVLQTKSENRFVKLWNLTFSSDKKEEKIDRNSHFCSPKIPSSPTTFWLLVVIRFRATMVGFVSEGEQILIHRKTCPEAIKLMSSRGEDIVQATWNKFKVLSYLTHLYVRGFDRRGNGQHDHQHHLQRIWHQHAVDQPGCPDGILKGTSIFTSTTLTTSTHSSPNCKN